MKMDNLKSKHKIVKKGRWTIHEKTFFVLIILVLILGGMNIAKARGLLIPFSPTPIVEDRTIELSSLTLDQKIAQMVVVHGSTWNMEQWKKMQVGGIHFFALKDAQLYEQTIIEYQKGMKVPFMVTADLEGCWNPFSYFHNFTALSEINTTEQAYQVGAEEGRFLHTLGFTLDFSPVVDLKDEIWKCRSFTGDKAQVTALAQAYIKGLQSQGVAATAKHYPGKTLVVQDPHKYIVAAEIDSADVYPFQLLAEGKELKGVMVSHIISSGAVDSGGKPAVVSSQALKSLRSEFNGIIFSDEVNMLGLKNYYSSLDDLYFDVFSSGNDVVVNFNEDPNEIYRMIQIVKKGVQEGKLSSEQIDASVKRILELKGFRVV